MSPRDARKPSKEDMLLDRVTSPAIGKPKYKLSQWVRISRIKGTFEKGFHPNFSYEIYKIVGARVSEPVMYYLQDYYGEEIEGAFYEAELTPVADPQFFPVEKVLQERTYKGKKEVLAKFLGYKDPRWIAQASVT